jgi:hypothetical protein
MSKKTFELSESKAIRVEAVEVNESRGISIRQLYKRKNDTDWQYGKQGLILPLEEAATIAKLISKFATSEATTFKTLDFGKSKEE